MKLLIIIPAYNEEASIVQAVEHLTSRCPQHDYIIVNDGSSDRTADICREKGYPLLDLKTNTGLAYAFQTGLKYAYANQYDCALQFDGDGQHDAAYIDRMLDTMAESQADIVIGSRFVDKKKDIGMRMMGSRGISALIKLTTGVWLRDPTSGMRLFNKRMIALFATQMNYWPEPDTLALLLRQHVRIVEVQVEIHARTGGKSYLNLITSARYMLSTIISILLYQNFRRQEDEL